MTHGTRTALGALAWIVLAGTLPEFPVGAQQAAFRIEAPGYQARSVTLADLQAFPITSMAVSFQGEHGKEQAT